MKRELTAERKTAAKLRVRIIAHGGHKKAPKLWRSYQRHKARIADLVHEVRLAERKAHAPLRIRANEKAEAYIGVMEHGGNNRGEAVEEIIRIGGGLAGQAWCGWFNAATYKQAGSKMVDWHWGAVRLLSAVPGIGIVRVPKRGNIVRYKFDHEGQFVRWVDDHTIETIEGNTGASGAVSDSKTGGDGVYRKHRDISLVQDFINVPR